MHSHILKHLRTLIFVLCACAASQAIAQGPIDIGVVEGQSAGQGIRIRVESNDAEMARLLNRAFGMHGGYSVVSADRAQFVFGFSAVDERTVKLRISSGGRTQLEQDFNGLDRFDAALRAADHAVLRTLNIPGIFAGTIAFISDRSGHSEVYLSDLMFMRTRQITRDRSQTLLPAISNDLDRLLYTSYHRNGFPDIYSIDLNSNRREVFAGFRGTNTGAVFSPDGRWVAMTLSGSGNSDIYVGNRDGKQLRRLTTTNGLEADASWAPDGQRLVFTSDSLGKPQIFTVRLDGREMKRVPTNISRNCSEPAWNPRNADQIVFTAAMGREFEIALFEFSKGQSRVITNRAGDAVHAEWTRDGRHLIYTQRTARSNRLMLLDTVTGKVSQLSPDDFGNCSQASYAYGR